MSDFKSYDLVINLSPREFFAVRPEGFGDRVAKFSDNLLAFMDTLEESEEAVAAASLSIVLAIIIGGTPNPRELYIACGHHISDISQQVIAKNNNDDGSTESIN